MAQNIRFHYLYRDSGNYKTFGFQDFSNPNNLSLKEVQARITRKLISGEFFYPAESGIEKFEFHRYCADFSWYEFDGIEFVAETKPETPVEDFIAGISARPKL